MQYFLNQLSFYHQYIPHGHCYLWQPSLLLLHIISDSLVTITDLFIPLILLYFIRLGGEELTIILPYASLEHALERAENLRLGIRNLNIQYGNQPLGLVAVSLGVAAYPNHGETPKELLQNADLA